VDDLTSRIAITVGSFVGGCGISRRWWVGVIAASLAWKYSEQAATALGMVVVILGGWHFLVNRLWSVTPLTKPESQERGDVIDVEFEVRNDS